MTPDQLEAKQEQDKADFRDELLAQLRQEPQYWGYWANKWFQDFDDYLDDYQKKYLIHAWANGKKLEDVI